MGSILRHRKRRSDWQRGAASELGEEVASFGFGSLAVAVDGAKEVERLGQCELLADEGGDETAAADFAAGFHATEHGQQLAPRGCQGFTYGGIAEDYAPTG